MSFRSIALGALLPALLVLAPSAFGQRAVRVGVGYDGTGPSASVSFSYGSSSARGAWSSYGKRSSRYGRYSGRRSGYGRGSNCRPAARRVYVPGRYETVERRVRIPGAVHREWVPPVYETRVDSYGCARSVLVSAGHYRTVREPDRWEVRCERVWVAAHWSAR